MKWSDKIDTREKYDELYNSLTPAERQLAKNILNEHRVEWTLSPWWARREACRSVVLYKSTSTLDNLNRKFPVFAHISLEDKTLVAYTPDSASGAQDRQSRGALSKLLARLQPLLSENTIRSHVEAHMAEADTKVTFYPSTEIPDKYAEFGNGSLGACMSNKGFGSRVHPTKAYVGVEGLQLAVIKDSEGKYIARSLVYCPSENDKRYIRCYGSPALKRWLENNGYVAGNLSGATLATHLSLPSEVEEGDTGPFEYAVPYLDADGGMAKTIGSTVALIDGKIKVLTSEQRCIMQNNSLPMGMGSAYGYVTLTNIPTDSVKLTSELSGKEVNPLVVNETLVRMYHDGRTIKAFESELGEGYVEVRGVYAHKKDIVEIGGSNYINNTEMLAASGFIKLSAELYPDDQGFKYSYQATDTAAGYVRKSDAVNYIDEEDDSTWVHKSLVPKTAIKLYGKVTAYAHKEAKWQKTPRGLKVHKLVHDLRTLYTGELAFARGTKSVDILGSYYHYKGTSAPVPQILESEQFRSNIEATMAVMDAGLTRLQRLCKLWRYLDSNNITLNDSAFFKWSKHTRGSRYLTTAHLSDVAPAELGEAIDMFWQLKLNNYYNSSRTNLQALGFLRKEIHYSLAEMYAEEAPERFPEVAALTEAGLINLPEPELELA